MFNMSFIFSASNNVIFGIHIILASRSVCTVSKCVGYFIGIATSCVLIKLNRVGGKNL